MGTAIEDFYESERWLDLRYRFLQKSNGCCTLCGCRATPDNPIQVDHIKPRSLHPELEFVEANLQVLCKACNGGKSNRDDTDWRYQVSQEAIDNLDRKAAIAASATPTQKNKLEQLSWLARNDVNDQTKREATRQYTTLWKEVEAAWIAGGNQ